MCVREDFLQFVPVYNLTGKNLANVLTESLEGYGINLQYLRGQGYDGAAAMSGRFKGVQSHISKEYPNAPYVHCAAHSLNLAVSGSCNERPIKNCMGTIESVYSFLNTAKRQAVLKESVETMKAGSPKPRVEKLKQLCHTRWIARHDSVLTFLELLLPVVDSLESISEWEDRVSATNASQLLCAIRHSEFIVSLHVIAEVFSKSLPLCRDLQKEATDLAAAMSSAQILVQALVEMRSKADIDFNDIFLRATKTCDAIGVTINLPRLAGRQAQRCNVQTNSPEEFFRIAVFLPFVDHFLSELNSRFLSHKTLLTSFMCLLPSEESLKVSARPSREQLTQLETLVDKYSFDVGTHHLGAKGELEICYRVVSQLENKPKNALEALIRCDPIDLPSIHTLLKLLATLPVSTSSSERSFSTMKRIKTYLRNTMGQDRLNGLALLNIHREISINTDEILSRLAEEAPRRINLRI
ncbi:52 kDa repressor of the inhibitor of the protein kinase-like [Lytechinus variegatus]|uniref:52 kDa repressor of the inhibitor of the protein kinase-like n=1 Tax=Lytechinus variegatus TaxID=7654 RepID=UPI001BB2839E|nr:52 kDa repressor of the inhibitor of the protein kinase-like [Lytechinus variegatus]